MVTKILEAGDQVWLEIKADYKERLNGAQTF